MPATGDAALGVISSFDYSMMHGSRVNRDFVRAYKDVDPKSVRTSSRSPPRTRCTAAYKVDRALKGGRSIPTRRWRSCGGMKFESPRGPIMIDPDTRDIVQNVYMRRTEMQNGKLVNTEFDDHPDGQRSLARISAPG